MRALFASKPLRWIGATALVLGGLAGLYWILPEEDLNARADGLYATARQKQDAGGDPKAVIHLYTRLLDLQPRNFPAYLQRAELRGRTGDFDLAAHDFSQALVIAQEAAFAYRLRGLLLAESGDPASAGADFALAGLLEVAVEGVGATQPQMVDPRLVDALMQRANAWEALADEARALTDYTEALRIDPTMAEVHLKCAYLRRAQQDFAGAAAHCDAYLKLKPQEVEVLANRGDLRRRQGDTAGAAADFDAALALNPRHVPALFGRGDLRWSQDDWAGALEDSEQLERQGQQDVAELLRGLVFSNQGEWAKAAEHFGKAAQADQHSLLRSLLWYSACARLGDVTPARKELEERLQRKEGNQWDRTLAEFLLGREDRAELHRQAQTGNAVTTRARQCEAWYYDGVLLSVAGQAEAAADVWRKCLSTEKIMFLEYHLARAELARAVLKP